MRNGVVSHSVANNVYDLYRGRLKRWGGLVFYNTRSRNLRHYSEFENSSDFIARYSTQKGWALSG